MLLTWAGGSSAKNDTLELSHAMCDAIGLAEGTALTVTLKRNVPIVSRIFVEPFSSDDWEVLYVYEYGHTFIHICVCMCMCIYVFIFIKFVWDQEYYKGEC